MATNQHTLNLDIAFFDEIFPLAYSDVCEQSKQIARQMLMDGVIQVETLFELAISKIGNLTRLAINGQDFSDKSDAKKTCVRTSNYGKSYSAQIARVHTKVGNLRVMCYERKQDKFYYFVIPRAAYKHIKATSNIEIPFKMNGDPKRIPANNLIYTNWWTYEVNSFEEMSTIKRPKALTEKQLRSKAL